MPVRNAVYALQAASKPQYLSSFHFPKQKAINYIMHCYTAKIVLTMVYGQISTNTAKMNNVWDFFCVCIYFRTTIYVFVLSKNNYWCTAVHKQGLKPKTQSIVLQLNQLCFLLLGFVWWGFFISRKIIGLASFSFEACQRFITCFESKWKERGVSSI